jgi:hypothetical protein
VPAEARKCPAKVVFQTEIQDKVPEGKGFLLRPNRSAKLQGINPGPETMERKCAQEPSLSGGTMGDEPAILEQSTEFGPKLRQSRCSRKIACADAMDFLRGPRDWLVGKQEAGEALGNFEPAHQRDSDLHGYLGAATADARALEINGGKRRLRDNHLSERKTAAPIVALQLFHGLHFF